MKRWSGFRSVLCPVDFSSASRRALRQAAAIAARDRSRLTVVFVDDPLLVAAAGGTTRAQKALRRFIDAAISASRRSRLRVESTVQVGEPTTEILAVAARLRCNVIVMGTHGRTAASRILLGSTTRDVLQRTKVPVLACPRQWRQR